MTSKVDLCPLYASSQMYTRTFTHIYRKEEGEREGGREREGRKREREVPLTF